MASACVNISPENFLDCPAKMYTSYGWLSPRVSTSSAATTTTTVTAAVDLETPSGNFEFRLDDDPVTMLPADELFSDGKLVPLHLSSSSSSSFKPSLKTTCSPPNCNTRRNSDVTCGNSDFTCGGVSVVINNDHPLFSPKAPRCSSRWRELLGLKKKNETNSTNTKTVKPFKLLFRNHPKTTESSPSSSSSLNQPLLTSADSCSCSVSSSCSSSSSSRISLSSSSYDHDELPRLSLDAERPNNPPRVKMRAGPGRVGRSPMRGREHQRVRGVSVDSPRMNPSGKIVFHSLERSSSSPSSFNGGRPPNRYSTNSRASMERSYSANVVRVTPVLNVPVCSLKSGVFGLGQLFSSVSQKKDASGGNTNAAANTSTRHHHHHHHHQHNGSTKHKKGSS